MQDKISELQLLVTHFDSNIKEYKSKNYDEANTRVDFIDKFFELLNWDVRNLNNYSELYRDVVREDSIKVENKPKAPDYSFRIGGIRKFFLEAKKPSINIKEDSEPAFQLRRYSYSAKLPLSILTDFEEFAVYDTRIKPEKSDKASVARIFYCTYKEYLEKFEFIYNTFSKEAILTGSFDKYIIENKNKKGTSSVDKEFLKLIENWRENLAKNIALRNKDLDLFSLNKVVQLIIDRIIFLRIAEDRNMERYELLKECIKSNNVYSSLNELFIIANKKYNSGLFHEEEWIKSISIDDKVLIGIIKNLYYPDCPYEMSILPIEILGNIYEQFLGKTIRLTNTHQAKIEQKEDVKKAGGVYYTHDYIVDYIIENTLGTALNGKDLYTHPKIKILDPSCGSGSFLVAAYSYLLKKYLDSYSNNKNLEKCLKNGLLYQINKNSYNLTIQVKQNILLNHIFGVDIDHQAVEVTKLSLLLKLLENENNESADVLFKHTDLKLLPDLSNNIKSGNSLIESDFFNESNDEQLFDLKEGYNKIQPFNWKKEFPEVFDNGGFDIIIGNPPYGASLNDSERRYLLNKYNFGNSDTAALFMVKQVRLLNNKGIGGYIIPKSFIYASNWSKIRNHLLPNIFKVTDVSKAWQEVKLEQVIYFIENNKVSKSYESEKRDQVNNKFLKLGKIDKKHCELFDFIMGGMKKEEIELGIKISRDGIYLNDYFTNQRGGIFQKFINESNGELKVLGGKQINRYKILKEIKGYVDKKYLDSENVFIKKDSILVQRIIAHIQNPYDRIQITASGTSGINIKEFAIVDTINQLTPKTDLDSNFFIGILNSKLISWYLYRFVFAKAIRTMQFDNPVTSRLPIPKIIEDKNENYKNIVNTVKSITERSDLLNLSNKKHEKDDIIKQIDILEEKLNLNVYEIYGLSKEDYNIIESSFR